MSSIKIYTKQLTGDVKIPPSKSMAHRAIICAALTRGTSRIYNIDFSDDIVATIAAMKTFGAIIKEQTDYLEIRGIRQIVPSSKIIDCHESGSTLRFLIPIALLASGTTRFIGEGNLGKRPLDPYYEIFDDQSISYNYKENTLDLTIAGKLQPGKYRLRGDISSQFISGLLFTLPLLDGDSKIIITTELESKPYVGLTLEILKDFGIEIINNHNNEFIIKGRQSYKSRDYTVEGDFSQGAFFLSANALGSCVNVVGLKENSLQGDLAVIKILQQMSLSNKGTTIDATQCPDIIPILTVVAALSHGITKIINANRLRIKECDRLHAIAVELNKLGAKITEGPDSLTIQGVTELKGGTEVWSHTDHRIAMSLAIAATVCAAPIILKDYECVSKSYPHFFEDFKALGGEFHEWHMGQ